MTSSFSYSRTPIIFLIVIYFDDKTYLAQYTVIETQNSKNLWFMDFVIYNHITYFCDGSTLKIFYFLKLWRQIENKPAIDKNLWKQKTFQGLRCILVNYYVTLNKSPKISTSGRLSPSSVKCLPLKFTLVSYA